MAVPAALVLSAFRTAALTDIVLTVNETLRGPYHEVLPLGGSVITQFGLLFMITFVFIETIDLVKK